MRTLLSCVAVLAVSSCKKDCPRGGSPTKEVVAPFVTFGGYPQGLHVCTPAKGERDHTFFFEGNDTLVQAGAVQTFFAAHGFKMESTGELGPTEAASLRAVMSGGDNRSYDVRYRSKDAKTLIEGKIGTIDDGAWSPLSMHVIDCNKPGNLHETDLCSHAAELKP